MKVSYELIYRVRQEFNPTDVFDEEEIVDALGLSDQAETLELTEAQWAEGAFKIMMDKDEEGLWNELNEVLENDEPAGTYFYVKVYSGDLGDTTDGETLEAGSHDLSDADSVKPVLEHVRASS